MECNAFIHSSGKERDKDEEEIIGNFDAITIADEEDRVTLEPKLTYSLKQLKECVHQGFLEQQHKKLGKKIHPLIMKEFLAESGIKYPNDYNAWDTALRETLEETGLNLAEYKPYELYTSDDFGLTNEERLHTKVTHYLFHLGRLKNPPRSRKQGAIWSKYPGHRFTL